MSPNCGRSVNGYQPPTNSSPAMSRAPRQTANSMRLARLLAAQNCAGLKELFHAFFASIPYQWYTYNHIADYEWYYASVFYSYFAALGYEISVEESIRHGRLDMAVRAGGDVYLFEFKVVELAPPGSALAQLRERDYAAKYRGRGETIHLIGVELALVSHCTKLPTAARRPFRRWAPTRWGGGGRHADHRPGCVLPGGQHGTVCEDLRPPLSG